MSWTKLAGRLLSWFLENVQILQRSELAEALWEAAELVVRKVQIIQRGELAEDHREAAEFVLNHVQRLQCSELAAALW